MRDTSEGHSPGTQVHSKNEIIYTKNPDNPILRNESKAGGTMLPGIKEYYKANNN